MSSFKLATSEKSKSVSIIPLMNTNHLCFALCAVVAGAAFLVALIYSITDISQVMAIAMMHSFYG
jgi:hypothetical protein